MNGFILLGYENASSLKITEKKLESDIAKNDMFYEKSVLSNEVYDNILSHQLFDSSEVAGNMGFSESALLFGDIYGHLNSKNNKLLNYDEANKLVQRSNLNNEHVMFEGNACIGITTEQKIIFQNDLEGYRKLFYYHDKDIFCISSHLFLIFSALDKQWKLRKNAVLSYISGRESKWPLTFVENILVLSPLSRLELTNDGLKIYSKSYSDLYDLREISKENLRQQLYDSYKLIIKRKSSENTAVTLSGGYDSNCLAKLYTKVYGNEFTAVSVGYKAKNERGTNINDETIYAEKVAQKLGIPFKRYFFDREDFFNELRDYIQTIDQPGHDPSSNFIMNKHLNADGYKLVVNGMGGDAKYSNKKYLSYAMRMHNYSKYLKMNPFSLVGKHLNYRGPFHYFRPFLQTSDHVDVEFHDLFERSQLFSNPVSKYINEVSLLEIDKERELRKEYFNKLYKDSKTPLDIFYALALLTNPDEYHALTMAERNGIEVLMPFVNIKAVLTFLNGSRFNRVNSREFEMSIFGGINEDLLAKSKSGFSIPYAEWMPYVADNVFEFYNDIDYFTEKDFDLKEFQNHYSSQDLFRKSNHANVIIWKLMVVKEYVNKHRLAFD